MRYPVAYNPSAGTYSVNVPIKDAHIFIWGGTPEECERVESTLRRTFLTVEDECLPDSVYREMILP